MYKKEMLKKMQENIKKAYDRLAAKDSSQDVKEQFKDATIECLESIGMREHIEVKTNLEANGMLDVELTPLDSIGENFITDFYDLREG